MKEFPMSGHRLDKEKALRDLAISVLRFMPAFFITINPIIHREKSETWSLSENQLKILMALSFGGQVMPTSISNAFNMQKGSITTLIDSLVNAGLVVRNKDATDRRKQIISLTSKGAEFVQYKKEKSIEELSILFSECSEESRNKIIAGLNEVRAVMDEKIKNKIGTEDIKDY
jgi:DNA-binding MarR family transcriptional regulator